MRKFIASVFCSLLILPTMFAGTPIVYRIGIKDAIDPRMTRLVTIGLQEATKAGADYVIIDLDTYGGMVGDADKIRTLLLEYEKPVFAFIDKNAASAGALIAISCDSIYMTKGSSMGAATVVMGTDGSKAPDKYQSYMRSTMRSTAEASGRDPRIAEGMVDESIEIDSITIAGEVITFTSSEALRHGYCEAVVDNLKQIMERQGVSQYQEITFTLGPTEQIISWFLNPVVSGLLILVILGGIYFELQTPGVGFPLAAALLAALLYFVPYYLNGLADHWEILLFIIGIALIAAEIFVIPGFGIAGISGIAITLVSLVLIMLENDNLDFTFVQKDRVITAVVTAMGGIIGAVVLIFMGVSRLPESTLFSRVSLHKTLESGEGYTSGMYSRELIGKTGLAHTVLRPGGKVSIDGHLYDAATDGAFVEKGMAIRVTGIEASTLMVSTDEKA